MSPLTAASVRRHRPPPTESLLAALPSTTLLVDPDGVVLEAHPGADPAIDVAAARGRRLYEVLEVDDASADAARWQMWLACALGHDVDLFRMYADDAPCRLAAAGTRPALAIGVGPLVEDGTVVAAVLSIRRDERRDTVAAVATPLTPAVIADARGALEDCDAELDTLARDPQSRHAIHRMFRAMHGLKGVAGAAGLADVASRAHRIEDYLQALRATREAPTLATVESLRQQLGELRVVFAVGGTERGPDAMTALYGECRPLLPRVARAAAAWFAQPRRARLGRRLERLVGGFADAVERAGCDELAGCVDVVRTGIARVLAASRPSRRDLAEIEQGIDELGTWLRLYHELHLEVRASDATADIAGILVSRARPASGVVDFVGLAEVARSIGVLSIAAQLDDPRGPGRTVAAIRDLPAMLSPARAGVSTIRAERNLDAALGALVRRAGELGALADARTELDRLSDAVAAVTWSPLDDIAARVLASAAQAATETGKQVDVELDLVGIRLPGELRQTVFEVLVHSVRNAIDHGIEAPPDRVAAGKTPTGRITALLDIDEAHRVVVEIRDDGRGVDLERVRRRALSLGMDAGTTREDLLEVLFQPGFSTATAVTTVSGRGVGMDAIRATAQARGGSARLHSVDGRGTILVVDLGPTTPLVLDPEG